MDAIAHLRYVEHACNTQQGSRAPTSWASDLLGDKPPARREVVPRRCNPSTCTASCSCLDGATRCAVHVLCRQSCMLPLPLLAAQQAQAQLVAWHGIKTVDGSPPPRPLRGYCGTRKEDKTTEELRHAPSACASTFRQWYADGSDPSLRACAERCLTCRESGGACRYVSYSFDRAGSPSP